MFPLTNIFTCFWWNNSRCNLSSSSWLSTRALDLFVQLEEMILSQRNSPLKQEEVDIIVALGEEVSQNASGITTADLIGWQSEVNALDKIPHLSDRVLAETPARGRETRQFVAQRLSNSPIFLSFANKITWFQSKAGRNKFLSTAKHS